MAQVKALGVWFSLHPKETLTLNNQEKFLEVKSSLSSWSLRRLSLIGKIEVLKSLAASQLVYVFSSLRTNEKVIKELNSPFFSLIWNPSEG